MLVVAGCSAPGDPSASLSQNVGAAFAPCNEAEIRFLAQKHNMMTSFRPCGNNHFGDFAWSPDGRQLYFQLATTHHVMNADSPNKDTRVVPTRSPVGPGAWLSATRLAVPVAPDPEQGDGAPPQLALFDTEQATVFAVDLPKGWSDIRDVQVSGDPGAVLLTAVANERRTAYRVSVSDGAAAPAFEWLTEVSSITFNPIQSKVVVGVGTTVTLHDADTGAAEGTWSPATRGSLHRDGRWLMLEHDGDPISVFYQRAWDELSEKAREREEARVKQFEEQLPESFEKEVRPPTLSFVDLPPNRRYRIDSVLGYDFEWYGPTGSYGSFLLWGFEGKQFKRNVMLGDFTSRMTVAAAGSTFIGVVPMGGPEPEAAAPAE